VSAQNRGYDIESRTSADELRFIEVKGRVKGADTVNITKNEILTAFNKPDAFILAIVEVNGGKTQATYLKRPFRTPPDFAAASVNYKIAGLTAGADVVYKGGDVGE